MKIRKHLGGHHQNRSNMYKLLVWQMGAGTAFPHGEMRKYCQTWSQRSFPAEVTL